MFKVKDVLTAAAGLIGHDLGMEGSSSEESLLLQCYNLIENEVALDYFPMFRTDELLPADGKIPYTAFSETPVWIKRVCDLLGRSVTFEARPDALIVDMGGSVRVEYAYAPKAKTAEDPCELCQNASVRLLAYGVAAEYLLALGRFSEAAVFDGKYRDALRAAGQSRRKLTLRGRRWA